MVQPMITFKQAEGPIQRQARGGVDPACPNNLIRDILQKIARLTVKQPADRVDSSK